MQDKEIVIKHLEMIQGVVNRLGHDSFLIKGWSMAILAAGIIFITRIEVQQSRWVILAFLIPVLGFWTIDGYFLWQERLFRKVYDEVRVQESTDFSMNPMKHKQEHKCTWSASMFSLTLNIFYGIEMLFVAGVVALFSLTAGGD